MIKIDQKIVGYSVIDAKAEPKPEEKKSKMSELRIRPETLRGTTYKIKTPLSEHALYVTINDHDGKPFELFVNSKAMEHFQWIVAFTRLVSAVFRQGGEVSFLVEELRSVFDPKGGYFKRGGKYMPSLVAEIGDVIESHLKSCGAIVEDDSLAMAARKMIAEKEEKSSAFPKEATLCGKCQTVAAIVMDGCLTCLNCGDSKCS